LVIEAAEQLYTGWAGQPSVAVQSVFVFYDTGTGLIVGFTLCWLPVTVRICICASIMSVTVQSDGESKGKVVDG
jgi:hypothetical protein